MGIRFHKSFGLARLLRLNMSKTGPSLSIGKPGSGINLGPRGLRSTVGLPGTGFSYMLTGKKWTTLLLALAILAFLAYSLYTGQ